MNKFINTLLLVAVLALAWVVAGDVVERRSARFGSVEAGGNAYTSTTTPAVTDLTVLCVGKGTLGSVNILSANTGYLALFDATTSDTTKRIVTSTTTSQLAWFPPSASNTPSVHFDIQFKYGLLVDYTATAPTSTISYRCAD